MSNIIPMVSSSPPPMDEGGGFDWDDDDDFGTFTSATDSSFVQSGVTAINHDSPFKSPLPDQFNGGQHDSDFGDFANFETHSENGPHESVNPQYSKNLSSEQRPESIHIEAKSNEFEKNVDTNSESYRYQTTNGPLVDSGVYSSNVSPVQHIESSGSDKVQGHGSEDKSKTDNNETSRGLSKNFQDNSKPMTKEVNKQSEEMLHEETSFHKDANLSVTQEKDKDIADSEKVEENDSLQESVQCIPPASIPENGNVHELESNQPEKNLIVETLKNENDNADVVIPNCDESHCENSNTPRSKSTENLNLNSDSSVDSQESGCSQNVCLSDHADDMKDGTLQNDTELSAENSADFKGSLDQSSCNDKEFVASLQRTESEPDVSIVSDKAVTEEGGILEEVACNEGGKFSQIQTETVTEADISKQNAESDKINKNVRSDEIEVQLTESDDQHESADLKQIETNTLNCCSESKDDVTDVTKSTETSDKEITCANDTISDNEVQRTETDNEFSKSTNVETLKNGDDSETSIDNHLNENTVPVTNTNTNLNDQDLSDISTSNETEKSGVVEDNENNFGDFSTTHVDAEDDFGDFNASLNDKQIRGSDVNEADDEFGDFNSSSEKKHSVSDLDADKTDEDFGDFNAVYGENEEKSEEDFGDFSATFDSMPTESDQTSNDWAAFSEPQIADGDKIEDDEDEWAGFEEEDSIAGKQFADVTSQEKVESEKVPPSEFANMSKHEKLLYAVTTCFPALVADFEVNDLEQSDLSELHIERDSPVWGQVKGLDTTDALSYQWTKSLWNTQLFSTLHIDTRNILIGHKKAPVPVFAAGLTLLEPTKGQTPLKPDVLVDTSKPDSSLNSNTQIPTTSVQTSNKNESIPAAQFDWSSSGLTNPLEANNKTLNLDFLIQDQATKSNALESEFLSTNDSPVHKPAIQPLENILANLKTSSTFKPTNQNEDISKEASKVVQSLPDLVFMKSKVLMFPVKLGGFEN